MKESAAAPCKSAMCDMIGIVVTVLQVGQIIPQHVEMYVDQSSVGVSPWLLCFGSLYNYLALVDAIVSGIIRPTCGAGTYRCFISLQPFIQLFFSSMLNFGLWFWYLRFNTERHELVHEHTLMADLLGISCHPFLTTNTFFLFTIYCSWLFTLIALIFLALASHKFTHAFGHFCGDLAAVLNAVMWLPQIVTTVTYGHKGALSIHWVMASVIMDVVYSVYLARMGFDMSVWLNNIPDGVLASVLLVVVLYYEKRDSDRRRNTDDLLLPHASTLARTKGETEYHTVSLSQ